MNREKIIVRTSVIGIVSNLFLAGFKAAVGLFSNSISVTLDAVNNLSDALSSVITIIGTKLSLKPADKKHPFGHGRAEYLTAMVIAAIVLYAGISSLIESVKKIITPETPDYSVTSLVIIAVAVAVKIALGIYVSRTGRKVNSDSLKNSGKDALFDAIISASVLVAAVVFVIWHISLEAYLGAAISLFIIKSGIDMFRETISEILGRRIDSQLSKDLKRDISALDGVEGAYDLVLHNYGPDHFIGSVHIEVDSEMKAYEIDALERKIQARVFQQHGVILEGISIYSVNHNDEETRALYQRVRETVMSYPNVLQIHGFFLDKETNTVRLDIIISFDEKDRKKRFEEICERLSKENPSYTFYPTLDSDISD